VRNYRTGLFKTARFAHGVPFIPRKHEVCVVWLFQNTNQFFKPFPVVAFALAAPVKPFEKQTYYLIHKAVQALRVSRHTVVVIVAGQFSIQFCKEYFLRLTTVFLAPRFEIRY
jgi:hypothetical protein